MRVWCCGAWKAGHPTIHSHHPEYAPTAHATAAYATTAHTTTAHATTAHATTAHTTAAHATTAHATAQMLAARGRGYAPWCAFDAGVCTRESRPAPHVQVATGAAWKKQTESRPQHHLWRPISAPAQAPQHVNTPGR